MVESASGAGLVEIGTNILSDPFSAMLVLTGALLVGASVAVFGYLVTGAVLDTAIPDIGREPPRQAR